ncbi:MAG: ChaN family lipoprotein [Prevotella sp.]|nr:ChaN family lipoprotein [Prevotella sp.]
MKQRNFLTALLLTLALSVGAQQPEAYRLYDAQGRPADYQQMVADLAQQDVVFVGEMHNCAITHWLELRLLHALYAANGNAMAVGMEMFEADNQLIVDEYLDGVITAERFEAEARLWPNYPTDYAPLVDFVREHGLRLLATNVPRRYANTVKNHGIQYLDSLSAAAKQYLPPLPITIQANEQATAAFGMMAMMGRSSNPEWMAQAQALKDATMAWNIAQCKQPKVLHYNGAYHTDSGEGIITYLRQYKPGVRLKTVYAVKQEDITQLEADYLGRADYYICVPEDMATSY